MKKSEIVYIDVDKLHPHPDNPRKELGDLTELADSIRKNGILQNLTVVPATGYYYGDYTVIIGHRRLAAAKQAGLEKLPCVIAEMSEKEQIATMLTENMQRSDLTVYEQAQGMQMMLDLGETVESVAEKTGFSKSTVRRRVKLTELDSEIFKEREEAAKNEGRQIALGDYERLFEIEDEKARNEVLKTIGEPNFNAAVNNALYKQKQAAEQSAMRELLEKYASEVSVYENTQFLGYARKEEDAKMQYDKLPDGSELKYRVNSWGVELYRTLTPQEEEEQKERSEEQEKEKKEREEGAKAAARLDAISEKHFSYRLDFVRETLKNARLLKECADDIINYAAFLLSPDETYVINAEENFDYDIYAEIMQVDTDPDEDYYAEDVRAELDTLTPTQKLLAAAYIASGDSEYNRCHHSFNGEYSKNERLEELYNLLAGLGYETSEEEYAVICGTHELYTKKSEE